MTFENGPSGTLTSSGLTGCAGSTTGNMAMPGGNTFIENGPIDSASGTVVDLTGDTLEYTGAGAGAIEVFGTGGRIHERRHDLGGLRPRPREPHSQLGNA